MQGIEAPLMIERCLALVCRSLFNEESELLSLGRFQLLRTLGSGGMGIVYEALDPTSGERVALKMLKSSEVAEQYRLKQEFRSLAQIRQRNLVALHELSVHDGLSFITMELIDGSDILRYVEQQCRAGARMAQELPRIAAELCEGIRTLHRAGKLHRDLKPSNVLVTRDGRVVLLDFGLVRDARTSGANAVEGTPAYLAPECYGGDASEASDWFSFGRILAQMLVVVSARAQEQPAEFSRLAQLAGALQSENPRLRPREHEILSVVGHETGDAEAWREAGRELGFVGRSSELGVLHEAFARSRARPMLALLRGEAGIGKTSLMREFVRRLRARMSLRVVNGRCYEREFIPYKMFDAAIDDLGSQLRAESRGQLACLGEDERSALFQLFPVLLRAHPSAAVDATKSEPLHPVALRNRGFLAMKKLLSVLAAERPLVVCIDNAQWSDADSGALLSSLLYDADSPAILIVACDRTPRGELSAALEELARASQTAHDPARIVELSLPSFTRAESLQLARGLLSKGSDVLPERIADESRGNPLFLSQLAKFVAGSYRRVSFTPSASPLSLDAIVAVRFGALSSEAQRALSLLALAGRPLSCSVLSQTLALGASQSAVLRELREARLVQVRRRGADELLEVEHDRIGEAILLRVSRETRRELHVRLASALDAAADVPSDAALAQYIAAGLGQQMAERARRAGELALAALAFGRAASLFELALELGDWPPAVRAHVYGDLALSHEHAGHGLRAAAAYRGAADLSHDLCTSVVLDACAAEHLIHNGAYREGLDVLRRCYVRLGLRWPRDGAPLLLCTLSALLRAYLGPSSAHPPSQDPALHLARARLLSLAGTSLECFDVLRTLYNALLMLREGEASPEPSLRARALGLRGLLRTMALLPGGAARGLRQLESAWSSAERLGGLDVCTDVGRQIATSYYVNGNARAALASSERCEQNLRALPLPPRDLYRVMSVMGCALWDLGELGAARRHWISFSHEARHQQDALTCFWIHVHPVQLTLLIASDDRAAAEQLMARQRELRALHPEHKALQWTAAASAAEAELYWGDALAALAHTDAEWRTLARTGYAVFEMFAWTLRARTTQAVASEERDLARRMRLVRRSRRATWLLSLRHREPFVRAMVHTLRAGEAALRGRSAAAARELASATALFDQLGNKVLAGSTRYCLARLAVDAHARAAAEAVLSGEGIVACERWATWVLPGMRCLLDASPR